MTRSPAGRAIGSRPLRRRAAALAAALCLGAAGAGADPGIQVEGNTRTRTAYVRDLVRDCLAEQGAATLEAIDPARLEQCVIDSEQFASVAVQLDGAVHLAVEERWTLIPVPLVQSQGDTRRAGLFLIESNFLGRGKLLVTGATFGNRGDSFLLVLKDPAIAFGEWTARAVLRQDQAELYRYRGADRVDGFERREREVRVQLGRRVTPALELGWFAAAADRRYGTAGSYEDVPERQSVGTTGPALEYDATRYRFYFREGARARLRLGRRVAGAPAAEYQLEGEWQAPLGGANVLTLGLVAAGTSSADRRDLVLEGGSGPLRGVERGGLWARHLAGVAVDYQIPFWRGAAGTWTAGPFACYARYRPPEGGHWEASRAVGAAVTLYLNKIALPGVGVAAGTNPEFGGGFFSVQVGMGF